MEVYLSVEHRQRAGVLSVRRVNGCRTFDLERPLELHGMRSLAGIDQAWRWSPETRHRRTLRPPGSVALKITRSVGVGTLISCQLSGTLQLSLPLGLGTGPDVTVVGAAALVPMSKVVGTAAVPMVTPPAPFCQIIPS